MSTSTDPNTASAGSCANARKFAHTLPLGKAGEAISFVTVAAADDAVAATSAQRSYASAIQTCAKAAAEVQAEGGALIGPEVYGRPQQGTQNDATAQQAVQTAQSIGACPIEFYGTAETGDFATGVQWCRLQGVAHRPIVVGGRAVGICYEDEYARYALLGNLLSPAELSHAEQTRATFESMEAALAQAGMDFSHVIRTWFYNDRILDWYDAFNRARDAFFEDRSVFGSLVPASTGVGSRNPAGSAVMARAFAVLPKSDKVSVQAVASPLQCPALDYRSSFSRAVEIAHPHYRQLIISGTASIYLGGKSAHDGDIDAQIRLSMQVVEKILHSRQMDWADTVRAVVYLKDKRFAAAFRAYQQAHGLQDLPCVLIQADVCRDELLFEIELDAARPLPY